MKNTNFNSDIIPSQYFKEKQEIRRKKKLVNIYIMFGALFILILLYNLDKSINNHINKLDQEVKINNQINIENQLKQIEEDRRNRLLDCITFLESNDKNTIILDSNNQYSYGLYKFQLVTLKDEYPNLSNKELENIAMDKVQARSVAYKMIFEDKKLRKWGSINIPKSTVWKIANGRCSNFEPDELNNYIK